MTDRRDGSNKTIEITYRDEVGETDGRSFAKWMGIGATAMMLLLVTTLSIGMIAGALGVGIGGFVASFGEVNVENVGDGDGGAIYPVLQGTPACEEAPQLNANLPGEAEITGHVAFYKDLPLPAEAPWSEEDADMARINIVADEVDEGDVVLDDLDLRLSALAAGELAIDAEGAAEEIEIAESSDPLTDDGDAYERYGVTGDPGEVEDLTYSDVFGDDGAEFGIAIPDGSEVNITEGVAAAHQVSFSSITVPDVDLFITIGETDDAGDGEFNSTTGVSERTVEEALDCGNLADESGPESYTGTYPTE